MSSASQGSITIDDPIGDATGVHDIESVTTEVVGGDLVFTIRLADQISPPDAFDNRSILALIDIDLDQTSATGTMSEYSRFAVLGDSGLGAEYVAEAFGASSNALLDASTQLAVGSIAAQYFDTYFTVAIDLADLGGDSDLDYAVTVGDAVLATPSDGLLGSTVAPGQGVIPEPGSAIVWAGIALFVGGAGPRRRLPIRRAKVRRLMNAG